MTRIVLLAIALFAFTFFYRFNTLGGALGGFDDDHFMQLAYANQIRAGERPVRDFLGVSLQGVWPPLGFLASAGAQSLLGANLRSEALLTASAMAAGAVITFVAASLVAPAGWALITTTITVLLGAKLYAFPKVLVLSAAALLLILYARRPSIAAACGLAVLTAAAFLFRHDYAIYVGLGTLAVFFLAWRLGLAHPLRHTIVYGILTLALLTPSLIFVQQHLGLREYLEFARENSTREASRTTLALPVVSVNADAEQNSEALLYWLITLLPLAAGAAALRARARVDPWWLVAVLAVAAMAAVSNRFMLRANLGARFGDVGPLAATLGAVLCASLVAKSHGWRRAIRASIVVVLLAITTVCAFAIGSVSHELATAGFPYGPMGLVRRARQVSAEIAQLPGAAWSDPNATDSMLVVQYVNQCTQPRDRIFSLSNAPELVPLTGRLFAGGVANLTITANTPDGDAFVLSRLQSQSVPIVLAETDQLNPFEGRGDPYFPRVHAYLRSAYANVGALKAGGQPVHVLATKLRVPSGTFRDTGLPCFR